MRYFLIDASALAKRYYVEPGSAVVDHLFASVAQSHLSCLMLGAAEVVAALVRNRNGGRIGAATFATAVSKFGVEVLNAAGFTKHPADNALIEKAIALLPRHPINSSDGVLLQTALDVAGQHRQQGDDLVLVASDQRLLKAAQAEGLVTFDPATQSQSDLDTLIGP